MKQLFNQVRMRVIVSHDSCAGEATYYGRTYKFSYNQEHGYTADEMPELVFNAVMSEVSALTAADRKVA